MIRAGRDELAARVAPELAASYERLRAKLGGVGAAHVVGRRVQRLSPAAAGRRAAQVAPLRSRLGRLLRPVRADTRPLTTGEGLQATMLTLVRHGQSAANAAGLLVGRVDSPLTELGRRQAAALGRALAAAPATAVRIITSPLQRAMQTAEAIAAAYAATTPAQSAARPGVGGTGVAPEVGVDERFVELDYGELDGRAVSELAPGLLERWRLDTRWRPPGGESLFEVCNRVGAACDELVGAAGRRRGRRREPRLAHKGGRHLGSPCGGPELCWRCRWGWLPSPGSRPTVPGARCWSASTQTTHLADSE